LNIRNLGFYCSIKGLKAQKKVSLECLKGQWLGDGPLGVRIANGVFWSFTGSLGVQGLSLLATIPVGRILGAKGYGELSILQSTLTTFAVLSGPSLGQTAAKYVAELRHKDPERAGRIIALTSIVGIATSLAISLSVFAFAPILAIEALNAPYLSAGLQIVAFALFFYSVNAAQLGVLSGLEAFDLVARVNFLRGLASFFGLILGAWIWGVEGAVVGLVLVGVITTLVTQRMLRRASRKSGVDICYRSAVLEWRVIFSFYLPTVITGIVVFPVTWIGNAMLVNQPNGYQEMGVFGAANQWRMAVLFLPTVIAQPALPILSNLYGDNIIADFRKVLRMNLILAFSTALIPALAIVICSSRIMRVYGADFAEGSEVLTVLVLTTVLSAVIAVVGTAIASTGKKWHSTGLNIIWAVTFIGVSSMLVHYGALGLAFAYLVSYIVHAIAVGSYWLFVLRHALKKETV